MFIDRVALGKQGDNALGSVRLSVRPSVYALGNVHPSVRPSVRPSVCLSVRPSVTARLCRVQQRAKKSHYQSEVFVDQL